MSIATEDYLKRILAAEERSGDSLIGLGTLADAMQVTPGTVTTMMKSLDRAGMVDYTPRVGVRLTAPGRRRAMDVLRRHRLLELFLVEVLGFDWAEVHEEAEALEHAVSPRLLERIDEILGRPEVDPHGDPIPSAAGAFPEGDTLPLAEIGAGTEVVIARVDHHDPDFLGYLKHQGLMPGARVLVRERVEVADALRIATPDGETGLSLAAAARLLVRPAAPEPSC